MRALALLCAALLGACAGPPPALPGPSPSPEAGVLDVVALLDLSGERRPRGGAQRNALTLWTDLDRARGGGSVRVRIAVVDVASSDARTLIELRRASVETRADAVIVGVPVSFHTTTFVDAARAAGLPIVLTLPAPDPVARPGGGRWLFTVAPTPERLARTTVAASARTVVLAHADRPIDAEAEQVTREHTRRGVIEPTLIRVGPQDHAAVTRSAALSARVHLAGAPHDWSALAASLRSGARSATYVLSWLTDAGDLGELRELDAVWPAALGLGAVPPAGSRRDVIRAYTDRHGAPTSAALAAYDAVVALALAAERVGADDREALREQLERTAFTGAGSTYTFSVTRHAGYGDDLALYRLSGTQVVVDQRR